MAKQKQEPTEATGVTHPVSEEAAALERAVAAFVHRAARPAAPRRRLVAALLEHGRSVHEVVAELRTTRTAVRDDIRHLRARAAERQLATNPAACAPLVLEEAEGVIRKVRRQQARLTNHERKSTLYHNLLKLEWSMLVKLFETLAGQTTKEDVTDEDDWTKLSYADLRKKAEDLGVDVDRVEASVGGGGGAGTDAA